MRLLWTVEMALEPTTEFRNVDEVMTADEAACFLKVSTKTVLRHARAGELPAAKVGRAWRFRRSQLLDFLDGGVAS